MFFQTRLRGNLHTWNGAKIKKKIGLSPRKIKTGKKGGGVAGMGGVAYIEFPGILKKEHAEILGSIKKGV